MKIAILTTALFLYAGLFTVASAKAQTPFILNEEVFDEGVTPTETESIATEAAKKKEEPKDITQPKETEKEEALQIFAQRRITQPTPLNFIGYSVQFAVEKGVPANTIILILLLPFLATIIVIARHIVGLPSLEMLVPIALSITLVSTGITAGAMLLATILIASTVARIMLKRVRIMQFPKMALSIFVVSVFVFAALTVTAASGILSVEQLSIFPILLLILLGEKIVALQLTRSAKDIFVIATVTLALGIFGFLLLSSNLLRTYLLLYPELTLLVVPINILIGRYFGLRLTEVYRFRTLRNYGSK